jgi:L-asparagine transporter-like permease
VLVAALSYFALACVAFHVAFALVPEAFALIALIFWIVLLASQFCFQSSCFVQMRHSTAPEDSLIAAFVVEAGLHMVALVVVEIAFEVDKWVPVVQFVVVPFVLAVEIDKYFVVPFAMAVALPEVGRTCIVVAPAFAAEPLEPADDVAYESLVANHLANPG